MQYQRSSTLFKAAQEVIPGGVNSPVRAFKSVGGTPIFVDSAKGAYLFDVDGNRLIDYISSWGPMILGHTQDQVIDAITAQAKKGTSYGMPTELETTIASLVVSMVPNIDKVRFVNSGTEACMSAVRLARGFRKREKIINDRRNIDKTKTKRDVVMIYAKLVSPYLVCQRFVLQFSFFHLHLNRHHYVRVYIRVM